jgi:hypothetical protein
VLLEGIVIKTRRTIVFLFALFTAYACLRYHVFKGTEWQHFPAYVLNKSISWTGLVLIGLSRIVADKPQRKTFGLTGLAFIGLHVPLSLATLNPSYHLRLFLPDSQYLTAYAEFALLFGSIALVLLIWMYGAFLQRPNPESQSTPVLVPRLCRAILVAAVIHVAAIGFETWIAPASWPGYLPPITLLAVLGGLVCLTPRLLRSRSDQSC